GYVALSEQSLQIRRREDTKRSPESDVTIYDPVRRTHEEDTTLTGGLALSVPDLLQLDEADLATYRAVGIYQKTEDDPHGDAVAWLELLSPSNKQGGRHFDAYRDKRTALLQAGLVFIELDYLHHQLPSVAAPPYPEHPESSCYRIVIIDPRPNWLTGEGRVYGIHLDQKLPTLQIPLNAGDVLDFDFDAPYQQTYEGLFFGDDLDYSQLPPAWERYRADDQARILTRLLNIRQHGTTAAYPPEQVELLTLADARQDWQSNE
ncbi:MAG: DUF4058 family protein, partial [Chloroflexota bacterium]